MKIKETLRKVRGFAGRHKKITVPALILILAAGSFIIRTQIAAKLSTGGEMPEVRTAAVEKRDLTQSVTMSGTVQSFGMHSVTSQVSGVEIKSVNVNVGDRVSKGDVIAILDDSQAAADRNAARESLAYTEESNDLSISSAQRNYCNAREDEKIQRQRGKEAVGDAADKYNELTQEKAAAESNLIATQKKIEETRKALDKETDPVKKEKLKETLEADKAAEAALIEQIDAFDISIADAEKAVRDAENARDDNDRAASRSVEEQREALEAAKLSARQSLVSPENEVNKASQEVDKCTVRADSDGVIIDLPVKAGDIYKGDVIATIQDDSSYMISATADQFDIPSLAVGQKALITVKAAEIEDKGGLIERVAVAPITASAISEGAAQGASSGDAGYQVIVKLDSANDKLRAGMKAKVVVNVFEKKNVLAVPDECIQTDEDGRYYIETVDESGEISRIHVEYGMKTEYYSEIRGEGVKENLKAVIPETSADEEEELFY